MTTIGRWLSRPEPWLVLALMVMGACVIGGALLFDAGRALPRPAKSEGSMFVLVGSASLDVDVAAYMGPPDRTQNLHISIEVSGDERFDWALVLTGAYAAPIAGAAAPIANRGIPPSGEIPATYIRAVDLKPVTFGEITLDRRPVSVIVGSEDEGSIVFLTVPSSVPLSQDLGDRVSLDLPVFGAESSAARFEMTAQNPDALPANVRQLLATTPEWSRPSTRLTFELDPEQPDERLDAAIPAPARASDWTWEAVDLLEIDAIVGRPALQAERESSRFLSGLLLGLAGGVLIWIFELVRDVARRHSSYPPS